MMALGAVLMYALPAVAEIPEWGFILDSASIDVTCDGFTVNVAGYSCEGEGCGVPPPQSKRTIIVHDLWVTPIDPPGDDIEVPFVDSFDVALGDFDESRTYDWTDLLGDTLPCGSYHIAVEVDMPCRYYNDLEEDIDCPCEGCTPGFWKQEHPGTWTGYTPEQDFDAVFGVDEFDPNITLLQALKLKGGGVNALARHAVAALLNAASPDVDSGWTTTDVIAAVQAALAGGGDIEGTKDELASYNESGCPLSANEGRWGSASVVTESSAEEVNAMGGCSSVNTVPNARGINLQLLVLALGAVILGKRVVRKK